jgi:hypothetical protein
LKLLVKISIPNQVLESILENAFQITCRNRIRKQFAKRVSKMNTENFLAPGGLLESPETARLSEKPISLVREVGFEPTNPYGTGASGLRFQDPHAYPGLFDLAWQHEPPCKADSRKQPGPPANRPAHDKALIGFPHKTTGQNPDNV